MPQADVGRGISLEWEAFGDRKNEPLLLVMGLGLQMIHWPDEFCRQLAERGFWVVRFDNRDVGMSTKLHDRGVPRIPLRVLLRLALRIRLPGRYSLSDMANDVIGLMDSLSIPSAHVVGLSMGGMIGQTLAIEHPSRVRSLVSYASSTTDYGLPRPSDAALRVLTTRPPADREGAIRASIEALRVIGSPTHFDPEYTRERVIRGMERSTYQLGFARQLAAILADAPRSPKLRKVRVPATVIHGRLDPLLPLAHGEATAKAIPNAKLVVLDTMGHDVPRPLWPELLDAIDQNTQRAGRTAPSHATV